jgi:magnesium chelatase family protein
MRQPMEDKVVTISRAQGSLTFPANFQLVAAMNPCPCGYYGDSQKPCTCAHSTFTKPRKGFGAMYQKRISGPLLDRIDIHKVPCVLQGIEVPRVDCEKLSSLSCLRQYRRYRWTTDSPGRQTRRIVRGHMVLCIRQRVENARNFQRERFAGTTLVCNADMREAPVWGWRRSANSVNWTKRATT